MAPPSNALRISSSPPPTPQEAPSSTPQNAASHSSPVPSPPPLPTAAPIPVPSPLQPQSSSSSPSSYPIPSSPPIPPLTTPTPLHITLATLPTPPTSPSKPVVRFAIRTTGQHAGADGARVASLMRGARAALDDAAADVGAALELYGLTRVNVSTVERAWAVAGRGGWFQDRWTRVERTFAAGEEGGARDTKVEGERVVEVGFASGAAMMAVVGAVERTMAVGVEGLEVRFCNPEWRERRVEDEVVRREGEDEMVTD